MEFLRLEVWGKDAAFNRPELATEEYSYDFITPSAARGILDAILYHPGMVWVVDRIHILSPIRRFNMTYNGIKSTISSANVLKVMNGGEADLHNYSSDDVIQIHRSMLSDVHYLIDAHIEMTEKRNPNDNPIKFEEMFKRRAKKGQYFHAPYLGTKECIAHFRLWESDADPVTAYPNETRDFGLMLYDIDWSKLKPVPMFFHAIMENGVVDLRKCEVFR